MCPNVPAPDRLRSDQFANGFATIHERDGAPGVVEEVGRGIDAEDVVDGLVDVVGGEGAVFGLFAESVGGADDLSALHATTAEEAEHGVAPVVSSGGAHAHGRAAVAAVVH